ncbi:MAG: hypothetical protein COS82_10955 [Zetaproteobacteria bacterium CG06_land_8_20_14_3_00_59_53]|nr:MAG: hypothetical protein AUK36_09310 [Zetaproteobacteria bacterium CG2_30_59_37]PIO90028.1 MAG: hypothetical protein COX56_04155 [Zetaproteobacteria bacterium CG23_combo_of_CG06-09_8_20_14_all_59_86]PIQ65001.1 MAG: hypothetical protein COV97_06320 [Zetaproteobacteria bacterium CG11_big_fil_rev_8_21_14_0_20_59_439]PIU69430.1 MAG: hypothetical protein COS82_10955 [Zetaproteobacteria bacterium CG06_land_8_20_14_3_00_59_53]PIU96819.1 MAG: hypothetical protein COS62_07445 [Zetaproteobacteria bac
MSEHINGVNLNNISALIGAIQENNDLSKVRFHVESSWAGGTQTKVRVNEMYANEQNIAREDRNFEMIVDEPAQLGGVDEGPNPVETIAAGLCGCITAGMATNGALFGTEFKKIDMDCDVFFDVRGVFGLDKTDTIPNGALRINLNIRAKSDADEAEVRKVKEIIDRKSPMKNTLELPLEITTNLIIE